MCSEPHRLLHDVLNSSFEVNCVRKYQSYLVYRAVHIEATHKDAFHRSTYVNELEALRALKQQSPFRCHTGFLAYFNPTDKRMRVYSIRNISLAMMLCFPTTDILSADNANEDVFAVAP